MDPRQWTYSLAGCLTITEITGDCIMLIGIDWMKLNGVDVMTASNKCRKKCFFESTPENEVWYDIPLCRDVYSGLHLINICDVKRMEQEKYRRGEPQLWPATWLNEHRADAARMPVIRDRTLRPVPPDHPPELPKQGAFDVAYMHSERPGGRTEDSDFSSAELRANAESAAHHLCSHKSQKL